MNGTQNDLKTAILFNDEDLEANKLGRLTEQQRRNMEFEAGQVAVVSTKFAWIAWVLVAVFVFAIFAVGVPAQLGSPTSRPAKDGDPLRWAVLAMGSATLVAALFATFSVFLARNARRNARSDLQVHHVRGTATKSHVPDEFGYVLSIGNCEFVFGDGDDVVYKVFEEGGTYSVHYVFNTTNLIVSAERE
ncbi:MAG TPA: hypothetical protein VNA17_09675 [Pyrinomonadaceae bacterium]|nr:hypothetical protein [Pyrinomonadaceae bacterium]